METMIRSWNGIEIKWNQKIMELKWIKKIKIAGMEWN